MVVSGIDFCLALHRSPTKSRGTKDCLRQALAAGVPVYLIDDDQGIPARSQAGDKRLM
jgi:hypothetical protein